jgi:hypothetical protein
MTLAEPPPPPHGGGREGGVFPILCIYISKIADIYFNITLRIDAFTEERKKD